MKNKIEKNIFFKRVVTTGIFHGIGVEFRIIKREVDLQTFPGLLPPKNGERWTHFEERDMCNKGFTKPLSLQSKYMAQLSKCSLVKGQKQTNMQGLPMYCCKSAWNFGNQNEALETSGAKCLPPWLPPPLALFLRDQSSSMSRGDGTLRFPMRFIESRDGPPEE